MCYKLKGEELRGNRHKHNTNSPMGVDAKAKTQEEYCNTVRSSVKSGRSEQLSVGGIKLRQQPGPRDHQAGVEARGHSNLKRGRQGHRHTVSIAGCYRSCCLDYKSGMKQSSGSARRGPKVTRSLVTSCVQ